MSSAGLVTFVGWRFLKARRVRRKLPSLLAQGAVVVDVRSRAEYVAGASPGSINIPLSELENGAEALSREKPVILCCASGTRSSMAAAILKRKGFRITVNAGSWKNTVI